MLMCLSQVPPAEGAQQTLEERLFYVLYGASLSLSSISEELHSPAEAPAHDEDTQLKLLQLEVRRVTVATTNTNGL